jgi:hypothetical protein
MTNEDPTPPSKNTKNKSSEEKKDIVLSEADKLAFEKALKSSLTQYGKITDRQKKDASRYEDDSSAEATSNAIFNTLNEFFDGFILIGVTPEGGDFVLHHAHSRRDFRAVRSLMMDWLTGRLADDEDEFDPDDH